MIVLKPASRRRHRYVPKVCSSSWAITDHAASPTMRNGRPLRSTRCRLACSTVKGKAVLAPAVSEGLCNEQSMALVAAIGTEHPATTMPMASTAATRDLPADIWVDLRLEEASMDAPSG
ncbi:hypothetical protein GCM10027053_03230 [Intrasporangium mesophilum]